MLTTLLTIFGCEKIENLKGGESKKAALPEVKIGVSISGTKNPFFAGAMESFIKFPQSHPRVTIISNDAGNDFDKQMKALDDMIADGAQAIIVNMVDSKKSQAVFERVQKASIPVIFFNRSPGQEKLFSYDKAIFVDGDAVQGGVMQGKAVLEGWKAHPEWDKNKDGKIQYAMLMGFENNPSAIARTRWSSSTMNSYPALSVPTEEVGFKVANFNLDIARDTVKEWLEAGKGEEIEVILANNDMMAIGALEATKNFDINIPIFGIDAIPKARELVKSGELSNTIVNDVASQADACIFAAINLVQGNPAHEGTQFRTDYQTILVPYKSL